MPAIAFSAKHVGRPKRPRRAITRQIAPFALGLIAAPAQAAEPTFDPLWSLCLATRPPVAPGEFWAAWSLAPAVVIPLLAVLALYVRGLIASGRRAGGPGVPAGRVACFAAGWLLLAVALVSPLCRLAATLVSVHMVQHVLLVAVAPPLLVLGVPRGMLRNALPDARGGANHRRLGRGPAGLGSWVGSLFVAGSLYGAAIWLWHLPAVYETVLVDPMIHTAAYVLLVTVAVLYWRAVLGEAGSARAGSAVMSMLTTLIHTGLLGALMTFASRPWYPVLDAGSGIWDLTPLEDQQLAGLIMWVPMGAVYLCAGLALAATWLDSIARRGEAA